MREVGTITKTEGVFVSVRVQKKDECSKCGMCLFPKNADSIELRVYNTVGADAGDSVLIENKESSKLLGAILAFFIPLVLIVISALISLLIIEKEIFVLILGISSVVVWYIILPQIDKRLKKSKRFCAETLKIVKKAEEQ